MSKFWLKITVFAVLVIGMAVGAYVLWPAETKPIPESIDKRLQLKVEKGKLKPSADITQIPTAEPGQGYYYPDEKIAVKFPDNLQPGKEVTLPRNPPPWSKEQPTLADRRIRPQYPNGTEAEKAGQQWEQKRDAIYKREILSWYLNSLRTKELDEQVKPDVPEGAELKLTDEQIEQMHEEAIEAVLEQYKDNPEQAEQVKEFLLERLKYHRKMRNAAKEKEAPSE